MKKFIIISLVLIVTCFQSFSQRNRIQRAFQTYDAGEYIEAIDMLNEAYNETKDKVEKAKILFYIAECYRKTDNPAKAENQYRKAIAKDYPDPIAILYYADALKMNEKYEDALEQYKLYKERVPDDLRGEQGISSCRMSLAWIDNPSGYVVENMKYFNSRQNDFSPCYAKDDYSVVYFTSSRENSTGDDLHGGTGENFADIYVSVKDRKGSWSTPVPLDENINSEYEDGTPVLTNNYNEMLFTRCEMSKNKSMGAIFALFDIIAP